MIVHIVIDKNCGTMFHLLTPKTKVHNFNTTIASTASRDGVSPANVHTNTAENHQSLQPFADGQTEETVVSGTPSVVEVPAAETVVDFSTYITHTSVVATIITVEIAGTAGDVNSVEFTIKVNDAEEKQTLSAESVLTTAWTYPGTTLSLSFPSRSSAFRFTGSATTEIIIPSQHTHLTVDGIETAVDLPGLTTLIEVTESTNVIIDLPEVTTTLEIDPDTYSLTVMAYTISTGGDGQEAKSSYCGTRVMNGDTNSACVMSLTTTITLPTTAPVLYLNAPGLTTSFMLPGITTTFIPELNIR